MRYRIAAVALAASLAGCSSSASGGVSAAAYVKSLCGAVGPFERDVVSRSSALDVAIFRSPVQSKRALEGFIAAIDADAAGALSKLRRAGAPDVAHGPAIARAVVGAFARLAGTMHTALAEAQALPVDSAAAFRVQALALGANVRSSLSNFPALSSKALHSSDLDRAAANEPTCRIGG